MRTAIHRALAQHPGLDFSSDVATPVTDMQGRSWQCDVAVANLALIVEFDGHYWHQSSESEQRDRLKSHSLREAGWDVVRVREAPLPRLGEVDLVVRNGIGPQPLAREALAHLKRLGYPVATLSDEVWLDVRAEAINAVDVRRYRRSA